MINNSSPSTNDSPWTTAAFAQIIETSPHSVAIIGLDRKIIWANQTAQQWFGYTLEECKGKLLSELIVGAATDASAVEQAILSIAQKQSYKTDMLVYRKDGSTMWVRLTVQPLLNLEGVVNSFCLFSENVTSEKLAQIETEKAKSKYQQVLDNVSDVVFNMNSSGQFSYLNASWERVTGFTVEETIGKELNEFVFPDDSGSVVTFINNAHLLSDLDSYFELRIVTQQNNVKWLEVTYHAEWNNEQEFKGISGTLKDVTKERELKHYYELLLNNVGDFISLHEEDGTYVYASPSIKEIGGYEPEELVGKNAYRFFHKDDILRIAQNHEAYLLNGDKGLESITFRYRRKDETFTWLESKVRRFFDRYANKNRLVVSSKVADNHVTTEQQLVQELKQEKKLLELKSNFVSFVSHEFKTPLAIIRSVNELLQIQLKSVDPSIAATVLTSIGQVEHEVDGLSTLIDDVLLLQKMSDSEISLEKRPVDVYKQIKSCAARLERHQNDGRIAFVETRGYKQPIYVDPRYFDLLMTNLLSNAFKYSLGKPSPMVIIRFHDEIIEIKVLDFGNGVPEAEVGKMYSPFFRASNVGNIEGTGLGLTLAKKIVELHGGSIHYTSDDHTPTTFIVNLPIGAHAEKKPQQKEPLEEAPKKLTKKTREQVAII